jgi:hypothetical protein
VGEGETAGEHGGGTDGSGGVMQLSVELPDDRVVVMPATPKLVSRVNCEAVVGMTGDAFAAALTRARAAGVPAFRVGRLLYVETAAFLAWVRSCDAGSVRPANDHAPAMAPVSTLTAAALDRAASLAPAARKGRG